MQDDNIRMAVSLFIKQNRIAKGLTISELARRSGVNRPTLHNIEDGSVSHKFESLCRIFPELGLDLVQLQDYLDNSEECAQFRASSNFKPNEVSPAFGEQLGFGVL